MTKSDMTIIVNSIPNVIHKPWGHERIIAQNGLYVVKELYVKANSRLSLQYHENKVETMFLVSGKGFLDIVEEALPHRDVEWSSQEMHPLFPYHIPVMTVHRLYTKDQDCLVVEISSIELDDVVRIQDDYGRNTK